MWWEPGSAARAASDHRDPHAPQESIFYRIRIDRLSGHRASPDPGVLSSRPLRRGWLRRLLAACGWGVVNTKRT